jgi:hypothetical protein
MATSSGPPAQPVLGSQLTSATVADDMSVMKSMVSRVGPLPKERRFVQGTKRPREEKAPKELEILIQLLPSADENESVKCGAKDV